MSHLFGLTPEEQASLTVAQWARYRKWADNWAKGNAGD